MMGQWQWRSVYPHPTPHRGSSSAMTSSPVAGRFTASCEANRVGAICEAITIIIVWVKNMDGCVPADAGQLRFKTAMGPTPFLGFSRPPPTHPPTQFTTSVSPHILQNHDRYGCHRRKAFTCSLRSFSCVNKRRACPGPHITGV